MSHHENSSRKPKVVPTRRNHRSRPSASRRNYLDQYSDSLPPPPHNPPRSKSVCLRFRSGLLKLIPREPQTIRSIRICFKCLPCVDNSRRTKTVKFRRPKSKRQLQLLRKAGTGKLLAYRESYLRLPPAVEAHEDPVDNLQSSGDFDTATDEKDWGCPPTTNFTKSSLSTISCADLEPPPEIQYGRRCSTPYFPPPTPFKDRNVSTPNSASRIGTPVSQRSAFRIRSIVDLCPRNTGSFGNFDFNKISRPHMAAKKLKIPPADVRRPNEKPIVPSIFENLHRARGVTAMKLETQDSHHHSEQRQSSSESSSDANDVAKPTSSAEDMRLRNSPSESRQESKPKSVHFECLTDEESEPLPSVSRLQTEADRKPKSVSRELTQSGLTLKKSMSDLMKTQLSKLHEPKDDDAENSDEFLSTSRSSTPTLEAEGFPEYEKTVDCKKIEMKHIKAELSRSKILEDTSQECRLKKKQWDQQRLIGLCQTRLDQEKNIESINITGRIESRFHHIHSFDRCMNDKIKVGRYFDMEANRLVVIKIYGSVSPLNSTEKLQSKLAALTEISALSKMTNCYNVVQMITYFELDGRFHLILESCDHSLRDEIEMAESGVQPEKAQRIIQHILNAVAYCHFQKCLHRDISPDNLLVTSDGVVKLADFDLSVFVNTDQAKLDISPGSIPYAAPELLMKRSNYGLSADIWSVGCVVAELLKGSPLWNYCTADEQLLHIQNSFTPTLPEYPDMAKCSEIIQRGPDKTLQKMLPTVSADAMSLISKCLNIEPHKRSTCSELLQHPFLMSNSGSQTETALESEWKAWAEETPSLTCRPQSALTLAEYESGVDDYDHGSYIMSCLSDVAGTTATDRGGSASSASASHMLSLKSETKLQEGQDETTSPGSDTNSKQMKKRGKKKHGKISPHTDKPSDMETEFGGYKSGECDSRSSRGSLSILPRGVNRQDSYESTILPRLVDRQVSCESAMSRRKTVTLNPLRSRVRMPRKLDAIRVKKASLTNLTQAKLSASQMCAIARNPVSSPRPAKYPTSSKEIMKYIIESLPAITGDSCDEVCSHLNRVSKTSPKMFQNNLNLLVSALLEQITIPKTKVVIPAMKILETLFEISPRGLNEAAEKIIDVVLSKVGGPLFIDNSCCRILSKLVDNLEPHRFCWHLAKIGPTQRTGMSRSVACKFLSDGVRCLNLNQDIGDNTPFKRKFTNMIFDSALKFSRDSHSPTRDYAKELLCILVSHIEFWRLYLDIVPEVERSRVNRILDEIRRIGLGSKPRL